jgi:hypothetical protein
MPECRSFIVRHPQIILTEPGIGPKHLYVRQLFRTTKEGQWNNNSYNKGNYDLHSR